MRHVHQWVQIWLNFSGPVQWPGFSSLEMLSDHVETVIRVIEGTIEGRRSYIYMDGNYSLQINGYTMILRRGKVRHGKLSCNLNQFFHVGFHTQNYISEHFRSSWVCSIQIIFKHLQVQVGKKGLGFLPYKRSPKRKQWFVFSFVNEIACVRWSAEKVISPQTPLGNCQRSVPLRIQDQKGFLGVTQALVLAEPFPCYHHGESTVLLLQLRRMSGTMQMISSPWPRETRTIRVGLLALSLFFLFCVIDECNTRTWLIVQLGCTHHVVMCFIKRVSLSCHFESFKGRKRWDFKVLTVPMTLILSRV